MGAIESGHLRTWNEQAVQIDLCSAPARWVPTVTDNYIYRYARSQWWGWWGLAGSFECQKVASGNACPHGTLSTVNSISEDKVIPLLSSEHSSSVKALLADLCPFVRSFLKLLDQILFGSEPFASGFLVTEKQLNPAESDMKFSNQSWNPHSQDSVKSELHHDFEVL